MRRTLLTVAFAALSLAAQGPQGRETAHSVRQDPAVQAAMAAARTSEPRTIEDQIRICEIPAPPFKEAARARLLARLFNETGLTHVRIDKAGNVLGDRPGSGDGRGLVVLAAHLDTVFPAGTNVKVGHEGPILRGPGIGDNCRGLAVLVGVARALNEAGVRTRGSITFVADVGEEGPGDLRGMKQLFNTTLKGQVDAFVALEGAGLDIGRRFISSSRYRVSFKGPGGHSFGAFGLPNPIDAMGRAVAKIGDFQVPPDSMTTFNVGRIGGGTAVNAIPSESWMEVDLRSDQPAALRTLEQRVAHAIDEAVEEENTRWGKRGAVTGVVTAVATRVGERPGGVIPADAPIVGAAIDATRIVGGVPTEAVGSTDANYPASLGIPSITVGAGGRGTNAHAPDESFDTTDAYLGTARAVLLAVTLSE